MSQCSQESHLLISRPREKAQRASPEALDARATLIARLTDLLNTETWDWGHHHDRRRYPLRIEAFGSVRFGLATSSSDLDLCICDPYRPEGLSKSFLGGSMKSKGADKAVSAPEIYNMRALGVRLQRAGVSFPVPTLCHSLDCFSEPANAFE